MYNPLVSIIIPLFNAEKYIVETINSAINQTWANKEIIIIDDGSIDDSYNIAKSFEAANLKVFKQENRGASAARNKGLEIAEGEYIQFLDADDLLSENKVEEQAIALINNPSYIAICDTVYFKDGEDPFALKPNVAWYSKTFDNNHEFLLNLYGGDFVGPNLGGMVQPNCWLSPRKILDLAGRWNESLSVDDDGEYFCRVLLNTKGIYYTSKALNYYRKHENAQNLSALRTCTAYHSMLIATQLKYGYLRSIIEITLVDKIFSDHYQQITIVAYPKFKDISELALKKAIELGLKKVNYVAGPLSTLMSKIFGWKLIRKINYLRFGN